MKPIAYYPIYKDMTGSLHGGIMLSQLMYWFRKKSKIYKSREELMNELGFTMREYRTGRSAISKLPFLKMDRQGSRGRNHYTIDRKNFAQFITSFIKNNPVIAAKYYEVLKNNEDFKAYYEDKKFGIGEISSDGFDTSDSFSSDGIDTSSVEIDTSEPLTSDGFDTSDSVSSDGIDTSKDSVVTESTHVEGENSQKTEFSSDGIDTSSSDGFDTSTRDGFDTCTRDGIDTSLTENTNKTTNKEYKQRVVGLNDTHFETTEEPSAPLSHLPSEDKPQSGKRTIEYTPEFEFAWKSYKVDSSMKGSKKRAAKEFDKTLAFYNDKELIYSAIEKYKQSAAFEIRPAQAASFFSGIRNPEHKYYKDYVKGGYEERLEIVKAREMVRLKENVSQQEMYRKDLGKQGDLNTEELMARTSKLNLILNEKYGVDIGIFRFGNRHDWIRYTGPNYVAIPIKHPRSKTDKVKVLFHIDELRNNLYVHLHGHVWSDKLEEQYVNSNEGFSDIPSIEAPSKEELDI